MKEKYNTASISSLVNHHRHPWPPHRSSTSCSRRRCYPAPSLPSPSPPAPRAARPPFLTPSAPPPPAATLPTKSGAPAAPSSSTPPTTPTPSPPSPPPPSASPSRRLRSYPTPASPATSLQTASSSAPPPPSTFLNCTANILNSPLNCTSTSLCHVYSNATASPCRNIPCCAFRAGGSSTAFGIRVREEGCRAYRSFVNLDPGLPVDRWPSPAVELFWFPPPEPLCMAQADCGSGSSCGVDRTSSNGSTVSRCFCNSGLVWDPVAGLCAPECKDPDGCGKDRTALITGITVGLGVTLLASLIGFVVFRRHRLIMREQERLTREREAILNAGGGKSAKVFTGKELKKATNNFAKDRLLGAGGYGEVYKGVLEDGTLVAVKCAKLGNTKSTDQVLNEVRILCQVNHKSLVGLLGCCVELQQPLLVYEYISNGTLLEYLQGPRGNVLTWQRCLSIAYATAEGLAYLHFSAVPPIYHRDVKSSNILLDEKLNGKVADFGLSRLAHTDMSHISTCAQGTLGYLDPEYYRNYQLTDKSDVYSFGVVLLELLTSQKAIDFSRAADDVNLAVYVQRLVEEESVMEAVDPALKEGASSLELETMKAVAFLAVGCLEERRQNRPSMKEVAEEIDYIISIATAKPAAEE